MYLVEEQNYDEDTATNQTTKVLPVTIRITAPAKYKVKNGRVLVAILRAKSRSVDIHFTDK